MLACLSKLVIDAAQVLLKNLNPGFECRVWTHSNSYSDPVSTKEGVRGERGGAHNRRPTQRGEVAQGCTRLGYERWMTELRLRVGYPPSNSPNSNQLKEEPQNTNKTLADPWLKRNKKRN